MLIEIAAVAGHFGAAYLSWQRNKSIFWALLHFVLGWPYIIYYAFTK